MSQTDNTEKTSEKEKRSDFVEHLERTTEIVRGWPEWKQHILEPATPERRRIEREAQKRASQM